jgi:hypothetical protein
VVEPPIAGGAVVSGVLSGRLTDVSFDLMS